MEGEGRETERGRERLWMETKTNSAFSVQINCALGGGGTLTTLATLPVGLNANIREVNHKFPRFKKFLKLCEAHQTSGSACGR